MDQRTSRRSPSPRYGLKTPKKQDGFLHLLLFYILPFLVFNGLLFFFMTTKPSITITVATPNDYQNTSAEIEVRSILPIKSMVTTQESVELELEKVSRGHYTAAITHNGVIEVTVVGLNGMTAAAYEPVDVLDESPPSIGEDFSIEEGILTFTVEDSQSGVDFNSIRGTASDGTAVSPLSVNKSTGQVSFEMDSNGLTVHASDMCGNAFQTSFYPEGHQMITTEEDGSQGTAAESGNVSPEQTESSESSESSGTGQGSGVTILN